MRQVTYQGDYAALEAKVRERLLSGGSCHDFDHTRRVMRNAELLLPECPDADPQIVMLGALLHDIARPDEDRSAGRKCHAAAGAEMVPAWLKECGFPDALAAPVAAVVRSHRFRGKDRPGSPEADIVFDADKLDSLGAVGLGRAFLFAGRLNARLHNTPEEALAAEPYSREDTAYREFLVKLCYLPRRMRTAAGRKLAVSRAAFMAAFFDQLDAETDAKGDPA